MGVKSRANVFWSVQIKGSRARFNDGKKGWSFCENCGENLL